MKENKSTAAPLCIALCLLIGVIGVMWKLGISTTPIADNGGASSGIPPKNTSTDNESKISAAVADKSGTEEEELLAVWVPYMSLSIENDPGEAKFKEKFDNIVNTAKEHKMNALIVHVRPFGDSMYLSDYFPFSHILTGTQGENPEYDAMKYMIEKSHESGLEFHAWINPLRIKVNDTPKELSDYNPYNIWKNDDDQDNDRYVMEYDGGMYLNPAYEQVREYIINSIKELISRYDVDGIQLDDYFYPDKNEDYDQEEYDSYKNSLEENDTALSHSQWRKANINSLISGIYSAIKSKKSDIVFGISPQGSIENNDDIAADIYSWGSTEGYCDYLCPQIYFSENHSVLPFNSTIESWKKLVTNDKIKLYVGLALYKAGSDDDDGTWLNSDENIKNQLEFGREQGINGFMFYSFDYLENEQTEKEVENVMNYLSNR